jgi:hypothetical protein
LSFKRWWHGSLRHWGLGILARSHSEIGFVFEECGGMVLRGTGELGIVARTHFKFGFVFEKGGGLGAQHSDQNSFWALSLKNVVSWFSEALGSSAL